MGYATYNLKADPYPEGVNNTIYFLSTAKEGICNNFASTLTLMYRSLGVPARFAMGYVGIGNGDPTKPVEVKSNQAHGWTEIYLNGIGWVAVDATPPGAGPGGGGDSGGGGQDGEGGDPVTPTPKNRYNPFGPVDGDPLLTVDILPESDSKIYDGEEMNVTCEISGTYLHAGDHFVANICEQESEFGSKCSRCRCY